MFKMLIVDDEYLVRQGIRQTIDWESYGIEIAGEASNGANALSMALGGEIDIILSDVRMPVMDGLELSRRLRERGFAGAIIILSGYSDFDYARKAIECGVTSYLLKPVDNAELIRSVVAAKDKLILNRKSDKMLTSFNEQKPLLRKQFVYKLLTGPFEDAEARESFALFDLKNIEKGIVLYIKADDTHLPFDTARAALKALYSLIVPLLEKYGLYYEIFDYDSVAVTGFTDGEFLAKKLFSILQEYEKSCSVIVSAGISDVFEGLAALPTAYALAKTRSLNKLFPAINSVECAGAGRPYKKLVVDTMEYISKNYGSNLTIKSVAESLFVSESHLMHVFKENLNKTFIECLTDFRMIKAKELLRSGKYRVNEIAYMVGYGDVKHFGQVFKKQEGMTPSEFIHIQKPSHS